MATTKSVSDHGDNTTHLSGLFDMNIFEQRGMNMHAVIIKSQGNGVSSGTLHKLKLWVKYYFNHIKHFQTLI